ncbi:MAG: hypothetical protein ABWW65_03085 [Thermoprotei archaeon]
MIIVLPGMTDYHSIINKLDYPKLYITTILREELSGKKIVVSGIDLSTYKHGVETLRYMYNVAEKYRDQLKISDNRVVVLVNSNNLLDLAFTKVILDQALHQNLEVSMIIKTPSPDSSKLVKASFYAWLKLVGLYDVYINSSNSGSLRIILVDSDNPPQLFSFLSIVLEEINELHEMKSYLHIKLKRFLLPLQELDLISEITKYRGLVDSIRKECHYVIASIHSILDRASADLWSTARRKYIVVRSSYDAYKKIIEKSTILNDKLRELVLRVIRGDRYSVMLLNPIEIYKEILQGYTLKQALSKLGISEIINKTLDVESSALTDIYTGGGFSKYSDKRRLVFVSRDLLEYITDKRRSLHVLSSGDGELVIVDILSLVINTDCGYSPEYIPSDVLESYSEKSWSYLEQMYPEKLAIGDLELDSLQLHNLGLFNYYGIIEAFREKCRFIGNNIVKRIMS